MLDVDVVLSNIKPRLQKGWINKSPGTRSEYIILNNYTSCMRITAHGMSMTKHVLHGECKDTLQSGRMY
jgi:hypothetical protein